MSSPCRLPILRRMMKKQKSATPKERQMWAQIATRVGEVMANLTKGFDERQFNEDLKELVEAGR